MPDFQSHEHPNQRIWVDEVGALAEPITFCIADKKLDKAAALLQRVPAGQRKAVLAYISRYFPGWSPPPRQPERRECDFGGCGETFIPERSTARFCPKHRKTRKPPS